MNIFYFWNKLYFVYYFSLGLIAYKKNKIINKDFFHIVQEFQNLSELDVEEIIDISVQIKNNYGKKIDHIILNNNKSIHHEKSSFIKKITSTFKKQTSNKKEIKRFSMANQIITPKK